MIRIFLTLTFFTFILSADQAQRNKLLTRAELLHALEQLYTAGIISEKPSDDDLAWWH